MLKLLTISLLLQNSASLNLSNALYSDVYSYNNETAYKAAFAYKIVEKLHNGFRQWFFTIMFCEFTYFENRIVKYIENLNNPVLLLNSCPSSDSIRIKPKIDKHGETAYIVSSDEITPEVNEYVIQALIRTGVWKPRRALIFVINLPIEVDSYFYYTMKKHFQMLWSRRITNSVLIVWNDRMRMYSFNPFFDDVYEITYKNDISKLLAKQYHNLYGKELRLSVYRKIFISDETGPVRCNSSILIKTVMSSLNATCIPVPTRDGATAGALLDNGTATGTLADLLDGYTEMDLNLRILQPNYFGYIDTTYPLIQDELCFLIKKSDKQSSFTTTIKLITTKVLSMFALMVFLLSLATIGAYKIERTIWIIGQHETTGETTMNLVKCFLRQTCDITFMGPVFRMMIMGVMLYSLVINSIVDGIITSAITYPRFKPEINTLAELSQTNLTLAVHNRHLDLFRASLSPNYEELLMSPYKIFTDRLYKQAIDQRQFQYAMLMTKTDSQYVSRKVANMKDGRPLFHTIEQCPVPCFNVYGLEYGSPYLPILNKLMHHLNQAGILKYWSETEEHVLYQTHNKILYAAAGENKEKKPLNMENLREVFYVWIFGLVISVMGLIMEIVFHTVVRLFVI